MFCIEHSKPISINIFLLCTVTAQDAYLLRQQQSRNCECSWNLVEKVWDHSEASASELYLSNLHRYTQNVHCISVYALTHWGWVTHICVGEQTIIGSDNGLSPGRRQAIIWINAGILSTGPLGTNFSEISIEIYTFSFKKIHLKCRLENGGHLASASMS